VVEARAGTGPGLSTAVIGGGRCTKVRVRISVWGKAQHPTVYKIIDINSSRALRPDPKLHFTLPYHVLTVRKRRGDGNNIMIPELVELKHHRGHHSSQPVLRTCRMFLIKVRLSGKAALPAQTTPQTVRSHVSYGYWIQILARECSEIIPFYDS
jgi:hypothetical protein